MKKIVIINGPNLNMLGIREPTIYGSFTLDDLEKELRERAEKSGKDLALDFFQSNDEGCIIDYLHSCAHTDVDGIIINAGAYTHTSIAIRDALVAVSIPVIEVHISNVHKREDFRAHSYISPVAIGQIMGLGKHSYHLALQYFLDSLHDY